MYILEIYNIQIVCVQVEKRKDAKKYNRWIKNSIYIYVCIVHIYRSTIFKRKKKMKKNKKMNKTNTLDHQIY